MYVAMKRLLIISAIITRCKSGKLFAHHCPRFRPAKPGPSPWPSTWPSLSGPSAPPGGPRCARSPSGGWLASTRFGRRCTRRLSTPPAEALPKN